MCLPCFLLFGLNPHMHSVEEQVRVVLAIYSGIGMQKSPTHFKIEFGRIMEVGVRPCLH